MRSSFKPRFTPEGQSWLLHLVSPQIPFIFAVFRMNGNLRGNGCSGRSRPPRANRPPPSVIWMNAKRGDEAPVISCGLSTMLWGYGRQVIVTVNFYFYVRERLTKKLFPTHHLLLQRQMPPLRQHRPPFSSICCHHCSYRKKLEFTQSSLPQ